MTPGGVTGLLLAAGAGSRMGRPKALMHDPTGESWLERTIATLVEGGCDQVTVVLGAAADQARDIVPAGVDVVVAVDWATGQSASLRAGLAAAGEVDAVVVTLVDLPDVTADVVRRVLGQGVNPGSLRRATYHGRPGHPVLLGRNHWEAIVATATGDRGARHYLASQGATAIECGDLATGEDQDLPG